MKNVLIAVDFSDYAQAVALHTAQLAQLAEARLVLFYAYSPATPAGAAAYPLQNERWVQANLDKLARKLHKETRVSVTRLVKPGEPAAVTLEVAEQVKADIVILCHGDSRCEPSGLAAPPLATLSTHQNLRVLTISPQTTTDPQAIRAALAEHIRLPGYTAPSLLEAI